MKTICKADVIRLVLNGEKPPYVPWSFKFTKEASDKVLHHFGGGNIDTITGNHIVRVGSPGALFKSCGHDLFEDEFGIVWDRSQDKDIGIPANCLLPEPNLSALRLPDPEDPRFYADIQVKRERHPDAFLLFGVRFSLFERAWSLRGMENLLTDFIENPQFAHSLLGALADLAIRQVSIALKLGVDGIYFGDDWGQQQGLIMGQRIWREFLRPQLGRMYATTRKAGSYQFIHSCGDVDELFDDLITLGVHCFNPFQPEVMDVLEIIPRYRRKMSFWGGLSTQRTLPYDTADAVRAESRRLLQAGREGGYIFAPAHAVEGDVPLDNMLAFMEEAWNQPGAPRPATKRFPS